MQQNPLDGLNDLDWSELTDAYGAATGIPKLLKGLTSKSKHRQLASLENLYAGICHQSSTVYPATAPATAFLLRLAASPQVGCRAEIITLLGDIAGASGYNLVHQDMEGVKVRESEAFEQSLCEERDIVLLCRNAVYAGRDLYLELLQNSDDPQLVVAAAGTLVQLAHHAFKDLPGLWVNDFARVLQTRFEQETDVRVRKALVAGLSTIAPTVPQGYVPLVVAATSDSQMPVRIEAAFHLAARPDAPLPIAVKSFLADLWRQPAPGVSYYDADLPSAWDEVDEFDSDVPETLGAALSQMSTDIKLPFEDGRGAWLRQACFAALRDAGERTSDVFEPLLAESFRVWAGGEGNGPPRYERIVSLGEHNDGSQEMLCDTLLPLLALCVNLQKLWMNGGGERITDAGMVRLPQLPALRSVNLSSTHVTDKGFAVLAYANLEELGLYRSRVNDAAFRVIGGFTRLVRIWAGNTEVGDAGAAFLSSLPVLASATLCDTRIGDTGAESISAIATLQQLDLARTFVGDRGVQALARMPNLTQLEIGGSEVGDNGVSALAHAPALESLNLYRCRITDTALSHLAQSSTLSRLNLGQTAITDTGLRYLEAMNNLASLSLYSVSGVTKRGINRLRRALPNCQISE